MTRRPAALCAALATISLTISGAAAQPSPAADQLGIVTAADTATARLPATLADAILAVVVHGKTIPDASADLARRTQSVIAYLQSRQAARLRTVSTTLQPETQPVPNAPAKIVGYQAESELSFRLAPATLGDTLAGALAHGADALRSVVFTPSEEEIEQSRRDLAIQATKAAIAQATAVADAAGEHVVRVQSISITAGQPPRPLMMMRAEAPAAIPTLPGDEPVSVTARVELRIDR